MPRNANTQDSNLYALNGARKYLNETERQRFMAATGSLDPQGALFVLTMAWTGARVSEVLELTPSSFQMDRGVVAIRTLKRRKHHVREVPLPPGLMTALDREFNLTERLPLQRADARRIWPWHRVTAWRLIKRVMVLAGVAGSHASGRGLRHGFGVGALQADVPINLLQRWLGHARISTTAIYANASGPEELAFAARFWHRSVDGIPVRTHRNAS